MSVEITIIENGPAIVQNKTGKALTVNGELLSNKIALCRCGLSETKICCDGSHKNKVKKEEEE